MAKNFPFFKFTAMEWLTGDIIFEDYELQGIFINICALYWHRDGNITLEEATKRFKTNRIIELKDRFISIDENNKIAIKFLDEQLIEANHISKTNSDNGKKGALAKKNKANAKRPLNDGLANPKRTTSKKEEEEEKQKEEEKKEINFNSEMVKNYFINSKLSQQVQYAFYSWIKYDTLVNKKQYDEINIETFCMATCKLFKSDEHMIECIYKSISSGYKSIIKFKEEEKKVDMYNAPGMMWHDPIKNPLEIQP